MQLNFLSPCRSKSQYKHVSQYWYKTQQNRVKFMYDCECSRYVSVHVNVSAVQLSVHVHVSAVEL